MTKLHDLLSKFLKYFIKKMIKKYLFAKKAILKGKYKNGKYPQN